MTKLDDAIKLATQDSKNQPQFYEQFLNSHFYVPVLEEEEKDEKEEGALPLLVEANDKTYLMLFDTIKRLTDWADEEVKYFAVQGHAIVEMSSPNIYWALNYGTEQQKFFDPDEIKWLKVVVHQTKEGAQKQSTSDQEHGDREE